jgi:hypothetical protein
MCPACVSTAATILGGTVSVGGLAVVVVKALGVARGSTSRHGTSPSEGDDNGTAENRDGG